MMVTGIRQITPEGLLGHALNDIEAKYAPKILFVSGSIDIPLPGPRVSIVGTRQASSQGLETARRLASELGRQGIVIVSGLARGIDTAAHTAAIESRGKTIAVLGTPLDRCYPPENCELQKIMMREQMVISQYPSGHITKPRDFVLRNRTMALVSDASIIVEAGESSGALSQGWETLRLGRPLFISKEIFAKSLSWPKEMIKYGARKLESVDELLEALPLPNLEYTVEF
jgi:DNA processing protein